MLIFNKERLKDDYDFAILMLGDLAYTSDIYEVLVVVKERSIEELKDGRLIRAEETILYLKNLILAYALISKENQDEGLMMYINSNFDFYVKSDITDESIGRIRIRKIIEIEGRYFESFYDRSQSNYKTNNWCSWKESYFNEVIPMRKTVEIVDYVS